MTTQVGSVTFGVKLALDELLKSTNEARLLLQQQLKGQKISLDFAIGDTSGILSKLSNQILLAKGAVAKDAGEAASFQNQAQLLQELIRYKQQLADIENAGISDEEVTKAKVLAAELNKLNLDRIENEFKQVTAEIAKAQQQGSSFIGRLNQQAAAFQESVAAASQYTQALSIASAQIGAVGAQFNQFTKQATQAAIAFDSARAKVSTLSNDADSLADATRGLSKELNFQTSSTDLLNAAYGVLSSGIIDTNEVLGVLKASSQGAIGGFSDVETVATAIGTVVNAYKAFGKTAKDAQQILDVLSATQDKGNTTIGQYAGSVGQALSITAQAGVSFEELSAAVATATAKAQDTSSAVAGVRQAIVNLTKPTDEAQALLESFGITNATTALKTQGLVGILQTLQDQGATSDQLSKIFSDVTGLATITTLAGANLKDFKDNIDAVTNSSGKGAAAAEKIANSLQGQLNAALGQANEALIDLGNGATKAVTPLLSALTLLLENFNALPDPIKETVGAVVAVSGGIITLAGALAGVAAVLPIISAGFQTLAGITGVTNAGLATTATTSAGAATGLTAAGTSAGASAIGFKVLTTTIGALALKFALVTAAIESVRAALSVVKDGGAEFKQAANEIEQKLIDLEIQAGKTKENLSDVLPDEPPPTNFIDGILNSINQDQRKFNKTVGLPENFLLVPTNAQKQLNDVKVGVGEFQTAIDKLIDTSTRFKGSQAEAVEVQKTFETAIKNTQDRINGLDASKLGEKAYKELKTNLDQTLVTLNSEKTAFEKRNGLLKESAKATKDNAAAIDAQIAALNKNLEALGKEASQLEAANKLKQAEIAASVAAGLTTEDQARETNLQREKIYLDERLRINQEKLKQLQALQAITTDPVRKKELDGEILGAEQTLADDRLAVAQAGIERRNAAEEKAIKDIESKIAAAQNKISQSKTTRTIAVRQEQASGGINDEEAARRIAEIDQDSIAETIKAKQNQLVEERKLRAEGLRSAEESAQREAELINEIGSLTLQQVEAEIAAQKALEAERRKAQEDLIKGVQDSSKDATDAANLGAKERITAVKQAQLEGVKTEEEAAEDIARIQADSTQERIRIKQQELNDIQDLQASGRITDKKLLEESADLEKSLIAEIAGLRQESVDNEIALQERIKQARIQALNEELSAEQTAAQVRQANNDIEKQAIADRSALLAAQGALLQAQSGYTQQRLQQAIQEAEAAGNVIKAESLKKSLLQEQIRAQDESLKIEEEQLILKQKQNSEDLQNALLQAQIAEREAEIALIQAQINGASAIEISNLEAILDLRGRQLSALNRQIANQNQLNRLEAQTLALKQKQTREAIAQSNVQQGLIVQNREITANARGGLNGASSGGGVGGGGTGGFSGTSPRGTSLQTVTDRLTDLGNTGDLATVLQTATLNLGLKTGLGFNTGGIGAPGLANVNTDAVVGKLDQLIAVGKAQGNRPNLTLNSIEDLGLAGRIYNDISTSQLRGAGL